ncbi:hypothetical protein SAMN06264849_11334 [Melghirimyces algeriensis]|uniref:Uncharacterized protein n=1 Tax=Melghirimyces algeriensis TaxID=910412 RepID=A0A521F647_9BACL|nr:hypothetical protein SAMN06264849_11334 [Melghirimyces algeriensis]
MKEGLREYQVGNRRVLFFYYNERDSGDFGFKVA